MFWKRKQHRFQDELKSYKINECYIEQHNFLIYCNDILVKWLHWICDNNLYKMQINFKNEEEMKSFSKERDNNLMTWLKDNGYEKLNIPDYKNATWFCHLVLIYFKRYFCNKHEFKNCPLKNYINLKYKCEK